MQTAPPFTPPAPTDVPSFGTMFPANSGADVFVWLALAVTYGLSVWLLLRQELSDPPRNRANRS